MCSVIIVVIWISVIVDEIPSMNVVDEAIVVIVYTVSWDLVSVCPKIVYEIWVIKIYSGVYDCDHY